jgi:hypothetical protein
MSALFATALSDEPPSAVTPLAVLRQAQLERAGRRQRRVVQARRWGGAVAVVAAVVAAVVLLAPALFNRSTPSATTASETTSAAGPGRVFDNGSPAAGGSSSGSGSSAGGAESGGSGGNEAGGGSAEGAPASPMPPGRPGDAAGGAATSGGGASAPSASSAAGSSAAATGSTSPQTGRDTVDATKSAEPAPEQDCALPSLLPAGRDAALSALSADTVTGVGSVDRCRPGDVRGTAFQLAWPDSSVTVVVSRTADCRTCSQDDSARPPVRSADGSVTAAAGRDGITVRVTADRAAAAHLTPDQLSDIVTAVLDSYR